MPQFDLRTQQTNNVLITDPDEYYRRLSLTGSKNTCPNGKNVFDIFGQHYQCVLKWNYLSETAYESLRELAYSGQTILFDDTNVAQLVETFTYGSTTTLTTTGISNPSNTHIVYNPNSADSIQDEDDYESDEISTGQYTTIGTNVPPETGITHQTGVLNQYSVFKLKFLSPVAQADAYITAVKIIASTHNTAWPSGHVVAVFHHTTSDWQWLDQTDSWRDAIVEANYSTAPGEGGDLVDPVNNYVLIGIRSKGLDGGDTITQKLYYAEVKVSTQTADNSKVLTHLPVLSSGDVVSVKNLTTVQTLTLGSSYTISGQTVYVTGQNEDDVIEITYNTYHEMAFSTYPEEWLSGNPDSSRNRAATITLHTTTSSKV